MNNTMAVVVVSASGPVIIGVTALLLNSRLFNSLKRRIEVTERDVKEGRSCVK